MHINGKNIWFAFSNTVAVPLALSIAFISHLERPYWSTFNVFVVAKPISGAVRSKAAFRVLGTLAGAAVPPSVHAPVLLWLATSLWIGLCLYYLFDRRPRSYAFMLGSYTAAIVSFAVVDVPESIFDTSVARVEEVSLGVICAAVAHSVLFPQNTLEKLMQRIDQTLGRKSNSTCLL
jgi:uncharacterized membrane protein YccC